MLSKHFFWILVLVSFLLSYYSVAYFSFVPQVLLKVREIYSSEGDKGL